MGQVPKAALTGSQGRVSEIDVKANYQLRMEPTNRATPILKMQKYGTKDEGVGVRKPGAGADAGAWGGGG